MKLELSADEVLTTTRSVRRRLDFDRPVGREVLEECIEIGDDCAVNCDSETGIKHR